MNSPIRYFGGKGGIFKAILDQFPDDFGNDNTKTSNNGAETYIEPFGGSGVVLFKKNPSPIEIYNDLEGNVYCLFKVLSDKKLFRQFKELCELTIYSRRVFIEYLDDLKVKDLTMVERAFRFYYVNRVAYNGVGSFSCIVNAVRRGTSKPISDMLSSIDKLDDVHKRLRTVIIENVDALKLIKKFDKPNVFFYLDPPYHHSTRTGARYDIDMSDEDQIKMVDLLLKMKSAKVLLSGYSCELYDKLTDKGWIRHDFDVNTQGGNRKPKTKIESLWRNYESS